MARKMDNMVYVPEIPWSGLGHQYETAPNSTDEIAKLAKMDWITNDIPMKTDLHDQVGNYKAIYREDNQEILGVVNKAKFTHVQNTEMFLAFEDIIGKEVSVDTIACSDRGSTVFGCFKINESYKVLDDDVDHYFVVVNNHLSGNGKITILNTPVRVVCANVLNSALSNNTVKVSIPFSTDDYVNNQLAHKIIDSAGYAIDQMNRRAEEMLQVKIDNNYIERMLDNLLPYVEVKEGDFSMHEETNEKISLLRDTLVYDCIHADNLANYNKTLYQVVNGVMDFSQHYYTNVDKSYDLKYRMSSILGSADATQPVGMTNKFFKFQKMFNKAA